VLEPTIHPINASANTINSSALTSACSTRSHTLLIPFLLLWSSVFLTRTSRTWSHSNPHLHYLLVPASGLASLLHERREPQVTASHSNPKRLKIYTWASSCMFLPSAPSFFFPKRG